jgi:hypothetical protein
LPTIREQCGDGGIANFTVMWNHVGMYIAEFKPILEAIAAALESGNEHGYALLVRNALAGSEETLEQFLRSNTLWGGAGSIADPPFTGSGRSTHRRELERLLILLGKTQLHHGNINPRTPSWVITFEHWQEAGISHP